MTEYCNIRIPQGILVGKTAVTPSGRKYYSFEGIPYAKPPLGELRFRAPEKPDKWMGILDATKPADKCAQVVFNKQHKYEGSEDCLYLNIYSPVKPEDDDFGRKPVMVFIHGGSFYLGAGYFYRPDYFMDYDVVFVTINYRLGVFGFIICLDTADVPGNAGLKDIALAFAWIRENISKFGGDNNNVTAFGESGGGSAISCMTFDETKTKLFDKVILESATSMVDILVMKENYVARAIKFAEKLNYNYKTTEDLYEFLKTCTLDELMEASFKVESDKDPYIPRAFFMPVIEKRRPGVWHIMTELPEVYYRTNRYRKVPTIVGYNNLESAYFFDKSKLTDDLTFFIPQNFHLHPKSEKAMEISKLMKGLYFGNKPISMDNVKEFIDLYSDFLFARDIWRFLDEVDRDSMWFYQFCYMGSLSPRHAKSLGLKGASHSDQLNYHFYKKSKSHIPLQDNDKKIIEFFAKVWTNFAKHGEPRLKDTGLTHLDWPQVEESRNCLRIDNDLSIVQYPDKDRAMFWRTVYDNFERVQAKL